MFARLQDSPFILGYKESFQPKSLRTCSNVDNVLPLDLEITMLFHTTRSDPIFPQLTLTLGISCIVSENKLLQREITITTIKKGKKWPVCIFSNSVNENKHILV